MRVGIAHQGFIPHYRVRFFELLAARGKNDYVVFHGAPPSGLGHYAAEGPFEFPNVEVRNREIRLAGKSLIYQSIMRPIREERLDALVIGTHMQFVSNHVALLWAKLTGLPVLYWGQGDEKATGGSRAAVALARAALVAKRYRIRFADGYLAYTAGGAARVISSDIDASRVRAVGNTLDLETQAQLHAEMQTMDEDRLRAELGLAPQSVVLVYLGRIYPEKSVDDLIEAVRRLAEEDGACPVEAVIIGDGPDAARVRALADGVGAVHFAGEIRDQAAVARYLRVASAVVIPGALGLAVNHALAHGLPVITRDTPLHGPEIEYLTPEKDSFVVRGDQAAFVDTLRTFVRSPELREQMAAAALTARRRLGLEEMVDTFDRAVTEIAGT